MQLKYNTAIMSIWALLLLLLIAGVCGFLASQLMGAKRINVAVMIVLGFLGAFVGQWIAQYFGLPLLVPLEIGGRTFPLVWAIVGSIVVVGFVTAIQQH
jgi:uncharacterized membrane protein YeaQ/YmgE (transglycosylase-associated protein family)